MGVTHGKGATPRRGVGDADLMGFFHYFEWEGVMRRSAFVWLYYHLVFSKKYCRPLIVSSWRDNLHRYLGGVVRTAGGVAEAVGGVENHVHILVRLRSTHRLCDVLRDIKRTSSAWVHETIGLEEFRWQDGYAAFTVSKSKIQNLKRYIYQQELHHHKHSFLNEYKSLLTQHGLAFKPQDLE